MVGDAWATTTPSACLGWLATRGGPGSHSASVAPTTCSPAAARLAPCSLATSRCGAAVASKRENLKPVAKGDGIQIGRVICLNPRFGGHRLLSGTDPFEQIPQIAGDPARADLTGLEPCGVHRASHQPGQPRDGIPRPHLTT